MLSNEEARFARVANGSGAGFCEFPFAKTVVVLPYGTTVTLLDDSRGDWWQVEWQGKVGWITSRRMRHGRESASLEDEPERWARAIEFVWRWQRGSTSFGLSPIDYPGLDKIDHERIREIYRRDFWKASGADKLSWPLCLAHTNLSVTLGNGIATQTLIESEGEFEAYIRIARRVYRGHPGFSFRGKEWLQRLKEIENHERSDRI